MSKEGNEVKPTNRKLGVSPSNDRTASTDPMRKWVGSLS
jgi:hypothetical protein